MTEIYQRHLWLKKISPMVSRRFLVRDDASIADLHQIIQVSIGWSRELICINFLFREKSMGFLTKVESCFRNDPEITYLKDFKFREKEHFLYEYDFFDQWEHEIRVEKKLPINAKTKYPKCIGGSRAAPIEDCGGPYAFFWKISNRSIISNKKTARNQLGQKILE